jgi:hypothetical protein
MKKNRHNYTKIAHVKVVDMVAAEVKIDPEATIIDHARKILKDLLTVVVNLFLTSILYPTSYYAD